MDIPEQHHYCPLHRQRFVLPPLVEEKLFITHFVLDMGAAPPRQTEIRIKLPGDTSEQLRLAIDAFDFFGFTPLPDDALSVLRRSYSDFGSNTPPTQLTIVTSSEGFVRLGILVPTPSEALVASSCALAQGSIGEVQK